MRGRTRRASAARARPRARRTPSTWKGNLRTWASSRVVARGRDYYRQGLVSGLDFDEERSLVARVAGSAEQHYRVEIRLAASGAPTARCTCPYNWEPLCKHAVAALLAWQQSETGAEPRLGAVAPAAGADEPAERESTLRELAGIEREDRRKRAIDEKLRVRRSPAGGPLGDYAVSSGDAARKTESYRVVVRDAQWTHASCGCVDFATNELGTCKHIECVKRYLGKEGARRTRVRRGALAPDFCLRVAPRLRARSLRSGRRYPLPCPSGDCSRAARAARAVSRRGGLHAPFRRSRVGPFQETDRASERSHHRRRSRGHGDIPPRRGRIALAAPHRGPQAQSPTGRRFGADLWAS